MKLFYAVRTSDLESNPPPTTFHAIGTPATVGGVQWSLVIVEDWPSHQIQDAWEDTTGVIELHPWKWAGVIPTPMVTAFAPWGITAGDTIETAFRKIRLRWPACRAN